MKDLRTIVGNKVSCKAKFVTHISECARRYGTNASTHIITGVVIESTVEQKDGKSRGATIVTADYNLGGGTIKCAKINKRNLLHVPDIIVEAVPIDDIMDVDMDIDAELLNDNDFIPGNINNNSNNNDDNNITINDTTITETIDDTTIGTIAPTVDEPRPMEVVQTPTRNNRSSSKTCCLLSKNQPTSVTSGDFSSCGS
jgi:hypothetical protein